MRRVSPDDEIDLQESFERNDVEHPARAPSFPCRLSTHVVAVVPKLCQEVFQRFWRGIDHNIDIVSRAYPSLGGAGHGPCEHVWHARVVKRVADSFQKLAKSGAHRSTPSESSAPRLRKALSRAPLRVLPVEYVQRRKMHELTELKRAFDPLTR